MPLAAGGGAACVVVVGGGGGAGACVVVGWGDDFEAVGCGAGFGAGLATFTECPDAGWDGGLAAVAPLPPPPQPATTSATIGTAAAPARYWMGLVRVMMLLSLSGMAARLRAWGVSGMGTCPRLPLSGPQAAGRESPTRGIESWPNRLLGWSLP